MIHAIFFYFESVFCFKLFIIIMDWYALKVKIHELYKSGVFLFKTRKVLRTYDEYSCFNLDYPKTVEPLVSIITNVAKSEGKVRNEGSI